MKSETVKMVAVRTCTILAFAVASVQAMAGGGATYWWENPEVAKSVALAAEAKSPQTMSCDAEGNCLALFDSAGAVKAVYGVRDLQRRKGQNTALTSSFASAYDFSGAYRVGGARLRYYGKDDGRVYVSDGETERELLDLSGEGTSAVQVKLAYPAAGSLWLNILTASGAVRVYELAADGLSLTSPSPAATATAADLFAETGAPALIDVSADGLALFFVTSSGDAVHVARSGNWGLVDCVAYNASAATFPWRNSIPQTPTPSVAPISPLTVPSASETFAAPQIWPWAEAAIYQKIGWGAVNITSTFAGMTPGDDYLAEYHFAENCYTAAGKRVYNLTINNEVKFENLDSFVVSGNTNRTAVALAYGTTADSAGRVVFTLEKKVDNPIYCGFAVNGREAPSALRFGTEFARDGSTGRLTWSARDALAYYVQSAPSGDGPWTTILRDQTAKTLDVSPGAENAVYYRVVASNGVGTAASAARCNRADGKYPVFALNCGRNNTRRVGRFAPHDHMANAALATVDPNLPAGQVCESAANEHQLPTEVKDTAYYYGATETHGTVRYVFANLRPGRTYDARVYCQESYFSEPGKRVFSVVANGETVRAGIDPFAFSGAKFEIVEFVCPNIAPRPDGTLELSFVSEVENVNLTAIEIVENGSDRIPLAPMARAYARKDGVHVAIGAGTGELAYDVRRRPAAGGEWTTLAAGILEYSFLDGGGTVDYVYSVRATDADGAVSAWCADIQAVPLGSGPQSFLGISPTSETYVNANGAYVPYTHYATGVLTEFKPPYSHHIVLDPAPDGLYGTDPNRHNSLYGRSASMVFTNLYPSANYRLRLQSAENWYTDFAGGSTRITTGIYANDTLACGGFCTYREVGMGVFPVEAIVKTTPDGRIDLRTTQKEATDNISFSTIELFMLESDGERGVARARRTGGAKPSWMQEQASTLDLADVSAATGDEFIWDAMLTAPVDGDYSFFAVQGGSYALWIDDEALLEAAGGASASGTVRLAMGAHHVRARYVHGGGVANVAVEWSGPGFGRRAVPETALAKSRTADLSQGDWLQAEIGTSFAGDVYKVGQKTADGSDIWRMTASGKGIVPSPAGDASRFVYRRVGSRNFDARVRLRHVPDRSLYSAFGLMLRPGGDLSTGGDMIKQITSILNPGTASHWYVTRQRCFGGEIGADNVSAVQGDAAVLNTGAIMQQTLPIWQRVRKWREGGRDYAEFYFSTDPDATAWKSCGVVELPVSRQMLVGVCANNYQHDDTGLVTFEFDHFELDVAPPAGTLLLVR